MSRLARIVAVGTALAAVAFAPAASAATIPSKPFLVDFVGSNPTYAFTPTPRFDVAGADGELIELWEGGTLLGSDVAVGGAVRIQITTPLADGWHTIHATAYDGVATSATSDSIDIVVDTSAPGATTPDLLAADDTGASSTDNVTSNPRPRFDVSTEANARVTLYEDGIAVGSGLSDAGGSATVAISPILWLAPGSHCISAIARDALGNSGPASPCLTVTIVAGVPPFTTNLGAVLGADDLALTVRTSLAARASVRVYRLGRLVLTTSRSVSAGTTRMRLRLPASARGARRLVVVTRLVSGDGRVSLLRRVATR